MDKQPKFIENSSLNGSRDRYTLVVVDVGMVIKSWRQSLFSFEWLDQEGRIKSPEAMPEHEKEKRLLAEKKLSMGEAFESPVMGIGISDNIEIGMGRAEFLTLASHGMKTMPVHIPKSCERDFKPFLADVKS